MRQTCLRPYEIVGVRLDEGLDLRDLWTGQRLRVQERLATRQVVQWDVLALGSEHHTFHVHGHRWLENGTPRDTKTIGPAESFRIRWREEDPGTWFYHCHVEQHMMHGMIGIYQVSRRKRR